MSYVCIYINKSFKWEHFTLYYLTHTICFICSNNYNNCVRLVSAKF